MPSSKKAVTPKKPTGAKGEMIMKSPKASDGQVSRCDIEVLRETTLQQLREYARRHHPGCDEITRVFAKAFNPRPGDTEEAALLAVVQRIYREEHDCDTPVEKFIVALLGDMIFWPPTLEEIKKGVEELELDWRDATDTARKFCREHPELVKDEYERGVAHVAVAKMAARKGPSSDAVQG